MPPIVPAVAENETAMTVDELARRAGMTVRNVRAHQSRGLIPPPEIRGRTGYYGPEHLARLQLIRELQSEGYNLTAIGRLLDAADASGEELLDLKHALRPFGEENPEFAHVSDLLDRFGPQDPKTIERAARLWVIVPLGDDRFEVPSPTILRAGEALVALGVPVPALLDVIERVNRSSESIAEAFVRLILDHVVAPVRDGGMAASRLSAALEQIRPLASEVVMAAFGRAMTEATEAGFGEALEKLPRRA